MHHRSPFVPVVEIMQKNARRETASASLLVLLLAAASLGGCGESSSPGSNTSSGGAGGMSHAGGAAGSIIVSTVGSGGLIPPIDDSGIGGAGGGPDFGGDGGLPPGFTMSDKGGYKLGDPIPTSGNVDAGVMNTGVGCRSTLVGVVRDMKDAHPDFEDYCCGDTRGAVQSILGADQKPVYAGMGPTTATNNGPVLMSGAPEFNQWYRNVDGVNSPYLVYFFFVRGDTGVYTFHSSQFFPLDDKGWGNEGRGHNFHFATELHTQFRYKGGETFRFTGDDDLWVFINTHLAIDLGGVHSAENAEVSLDQRAQEFGLEIGKVYPLDLFQAERHTSESNFRIDTNLDFVNCGVIVPR